MTKPTDIHEKNPDVVVRPVESDIVLLDLKTGVYYKLNEVGRDAWEIIDGKKSLDDIARALLQTYEVEPRILAADLAQLLDDLLREGLVTQAKQP